MAYKSAAPLTLVKRVNGTTQYVYEDGLAPADAAPGEIDRLVEEGFLVEVDGPSPDAPTHVALTDAELAAEYERRFGSGGQSQLPTAPAKTANKAAWVEYAVSQGANREEAEAATKDDLAATYGA